MYAGWVFLDIDGTLIDQNDNVRPHIRELIHSIISRDILLIVWSGGGKDYAKEKYINVCKSVATDLDDYNKLINSVKEFRWKADPIIWNQIRPVFFIDDSKYIAREHTNVDGEEVFWLPFYDASIMKDDVELLKAIYKCNLFFNLYGKGGKRK